MTAPQDLLLLALVGGVLSVDRSAFLQSMACRPLVASTLAGLAVGEAALGLRCGCLLELLWLMELPIGAAVPPNETLAAVLAVAFAASAPAGWGEGARAALGVCAALPFGLFGRWTDVQIRRWNRTLLERARRRVAEGRSLAAPHLTGAAVYFAVGCASTAVAGWAGTGAVAALTGVSSPRAPVALDLTAEALPLLGAAAVLSALQGRRFKGLFTAGVAGALALGWIFTWRVPWHP